MNDNQKTKIIKAYEFLGNALANNDHESFEQAALIHLKLNDDDDYGEMKVKLFALDKTIDLIGEAINYE